jgi:hypothetical protein
VCVFFDRYGRPQVVMRYYYEWHFIYPLLSCVKAWCVAQCSRGRIKAHRVTGDRQCSKEHLDELFGANSSMSCLGDERYTVAILGPRLGGQGTEDGRWWRGAVGLWARGFRARTLIIPTSSHTAQQHPTIDSDTPPLLSRQ